MGPSQFGYLIGAAGACTLVTSVLYAGAASWPPSTAKHVFLNVIACAIEVLLQAVGNSCSFEQAIFYAAAQLVIAGVIFVRFRRASKPIIQRVEPRL